MPKDVRWEKVPRGEMTYERLTPKNVTAPQVLFHIHGGGFVLPLYNPERFTTAYLARLAGVRAVLVDYHLAPECPFPTAFEGGGGFYAQDDPMMRADFVMRQLTAYRGEADPRTPLLSPLYANLQGLPPILVQVGEAELFRSGAAAADP